MTSSTSSPSHAPPAELNVWLVEDNKVYRRSISRLIDAAEGMRCGLAAMSCEEAIARLEADDASPDLVLMDIGLPGMSGIEGVAFFRSRHPDVPVVMLTVHEEDEKIFQAICNGAAGYLLKPASGELILQGIRDVRDGASPINPYIARRVLEMFSTRRPERSDYGLTEREREILALLAEGLTLERIGERLGISRHTVDSHTRNVYGKLQVHSRGGAVAKALRERLI